MVILPREFGQVLNDAMYGLAAVWKTLLVPALVVTVPISVATVFAFSATGGADFLDLALNDPATLQRLPEEVARELARPFYLALGIAVVLLVLAAVFVALASHQTVAANVRGTPLTSGQAARLALDRYLTGLGATFTIIVATGVLFTVGAVVWLIPAGSVGTPNTASSFIAVLLLGALLGPGLWASVAMSMTTPAVAIERKGPLAAIARSVSLVRGRWWATAGFLLLVGLLGGIAIQLIQLVALPLAVSGGGGAVLTVASALGVLAQGLLVAGIAAMYTHWYIDLRARKERLSTDSLG